MRSSMPPGPRIPSAAQTLQWVLRPAPFMEECRARYGDMFTLRLGPANVVMIADPAAVKEVFLGSPETLHMGDINGLFRPILGADGLLLLDGQKHLRRRKLMLPPFHGERMRGYTRADDRDRRARGHRPGRSRSRSRLLPKMQAITVEVILRAVFGAQDGVDRRPAAHARDRAAPPLPVVLHDAPAAAPLARRPLAVGPAHALRGRGRRGPLRGDPPPPRAGRRRRRRARDAAPGARRGRQPDVRPRAARRAADAARLRPRDLGERARVRVRAAAAAPGQAQAADRRAVLRARRPTSTP